MLQHCGSRAGLSTPARDPGQQAHQDILAGIPDDCPGEPEDMDGFEDEDGCPDPDNDNDRIPDGEDLCPNDAEVYNAINDEDGCPDMSSDLKIGGSMDVIAQVVIFDEGSAELPEERLALMDEVAVWIMNEPPPVKILVLGHSGFDEADPDHGVKLSKARADAVAAYLTKKGVSPDDLLMAGVGVACYTDTADPAISGRVEFKLLEYYGGCANMKMTCDDALENDLVPQEVLDYLPGGKECTSK